VWRVGGGPPRPCVPACPDIHITSSTVPHISPPETSLHKRSAIYNPHGPSTVASRGVRKYKALGHPHGPLGLVVLLSLAFEFFCRKGLYVCPWLSFSLQAGYAPAHLAPVPSFGLSVSDSSAVLRALLKLGTHLEMGGSWLGCGEGIG
jgi:hypothetical protein